MDRVSTPDQTPPDTEDLSCELTAVVSVAEKFPVWEHVNLQRGVDAYLAAQQDGAEWFGVPGAWQRPHENLLSLIGMPSPFGGYAVHGFAGIRIRGRVRVSTGGGAASGAGSGTGSGAASYGTAAVGPEENTEVVTFGLVTARSWRSSPPTGPRPARRGTRSTG